VPLEREHDQQACKVIKELLPYFSDKCGPASEHSRGIRGVLAIRLTGPDRHTVLAELLSKDLKAVRIALGITHPDYIQEATILAGTYVELGESEKCEKICREVIDACRSQGCEDARTTGYLQAILVMAYARAGRLEDADQVALQYVDICRKAKDLDPMILAKALELAAFVASHQRDIERMSQYLEEVVSIQDSAGQRTVELAKLKASLGRAYRLQDEHEKAKRVLKEAVELFQATGETKLSDARLARAALGVVYRETGSHRDAIPFLKEAYLHEKKTFGVTHEATRKVRDLLVDSLRKCGQNDEADGLLHEPRPFVVPAAAP
jgi:tetratricopeptide (TPR) repeat protein